MRKTLILALFAAANFGAFAQPNDSDEDSLGADFIALLKRMDSIEGTLHYKTGTIVLGNGIATITVPKGFKFLESKEAAYVVYDLWENPRGNDPLGLLFPENSSATDPTYTFAIEFEEIGYVKDKDAHKIDYDDLLKDMKKGAEEDNKRREAIGTPAMHLVGWAAKPHYDSEKKQLYWAKEYSVEGEEHNTLNYDIRLLGRKGVLTLQAISYIEMLDTVNSNMENVLSMVSFNEGHAYKDFDSKTDNVAAWTIGGLVAGKVLAKAGFFAILLKSLKFIILGLAAVGGGIWRFITGRRKKEEEFQYTPTPPPSQDTTA